MKRTMAMVHKIGGRDKYLLAEMISHRFPLERAEDAIKLVGGEVEGQTPVKVVLDPELS